MYASPIVLIFSRPCRSVSASKALKISSSTPTTRSGLVRSANGVKSAMSANRTRHVVVALGDDARVALQPLGDRPRQDVEQEAVRLGEGRVASPDRVLEQEVGGQRDAEDVQDEERDLDARRDRRRVLRRAAGRSSPETTVSATKTTNHGIGLAGAVEEERTEDADERPQADGARGDVATQAPLEEERQQEDQDDLAEPEEPVVLRPGERDERHDRGDLVRERDRRRHRQAEGEVRADPDAPTAR